MPLPSGKTMFLWRQANCGSIHAIQAKCLELGLTSVNVKVANGNYLDTSLHPLITALRSVGLKVGGWHYVYGGVYYDKSVGAWKVVPSTAPDKEAVVSRQAIEEYNLDYFEIDAEKEYKIDLGGLPSAEERAQIYMSKLAPNTLDIPVGLSTYRFPAYHLGFPFGAFMANGIAYVAPQVYWQPPSASRGPYHETVISYDQYSGLMDTYGVFLAYIPAGRCYIGDGYASPGPGYDDTKLFLDTCHTKNFSGCSFWALDYLFLGTHAPNQAERSRAIAEYLWGEVSVPPSPQLTWVVVDTTASYAYLRPQPLSGSDQPYSGIVYDGKPLLKFGEVVNSNGETWSLVGGYVANWLLKKT
jgi:hypothetical protein